MTIVNTHKKTNYFGRDLEAMSFAKNYHQWIIDEFKPYLGKSVAEVGAGNGNFSELLMPHVKNLIAFEPSSNMYPLLKERFVQRTGIQTINSTFADKCSAFEGHLDTIVYVNVLEHIENDEQELATIYKTLKPGGYALIFVPALSFLYSDFDKNLGHFRRYHKKELINLVQHIGFKVKTAKYFDLAGIIPWYIVFVLLKRSMTGEQISIYDKLVVPIIKKIEGAMTPPIGKNLLLIILCLEYFDY